MFVMLILHVDKLYETAVKIFEWFPNSHPKSNPTRLRIIVISRMSTEVVLPGLVEC